MKKIFFLSFLYLLNFASGAQSEDDPDYRIEDQFHDIYKKFNENPVSEESWNKAYSLVKAKEYSVVKTDTLWDISQVLFADPVFWPKIWSFNTSEVLNPHEILPGWKIRFFPGTVDSAPSLKVLEYQGVAIPPQKVSPPVTEIPPSIPQYIPEIPSFEIAKLIPTDRSALVRIPLLPLPVELFRDRPESRGKIIEMEEGARFADFGRDVFVELEDRVAPGRFSVIKNIEKNKHGYIVQYRGEIEVLSRINDSENVYRARITKLLDSIELGDFLVSGEIPMVDISEKPKVTSAPFVSIIGGFKSPTDLLFSPYSIVFLDGGLREGLREGDVLNVYQEPKSRLSYTKQKKSYREIGTIKIIRTQDTVSTGYILSSKTEIREGDFAGFEKTDSGTATGSEDDNLILE